MDDVREEDVGAELCAEYAVGLEGLAEMCEDGRTRRALQRAAAALAELAEALDNEDDAALERLCPER